MPVGDGASGLAAIARVGVPAPMRPRGALAVSLGWGYTEGVLGTGDTHHRLAGSLAGNLTVLPWLGVGLRFDGRYDAHSGGPNGSDDGWVGDPRLIVRARSPFRHVPWLGAQLTVWAPGADAPSLVPEATSFDLALLGALPYGRWVFGANVGYRVDRSAAALSNRDDLSTADRISFGASDSDAILLGVGARTVVTPNVELLAESTWDVLVGSDAPSAFDAPLRLGAGARWAMTGRFALSGLVEVGAGGRPPVGPGRPLAPIEPRVSLQVGLGVSLDPVARPAVVARRTPPPVERPAVEAPAALNGRVTTPSGVALANARVQVVSPSGTHELRTDASGAFTVPSIRAGAVTLRFSAEGHRDVERTVELRAGQTESLEQALPFDLPAGQIRGVISAFRGDALRATITVESLGTTATTDAEGAFQVEVPPGTYVVVVESPGYRTQRRRIRVDENGVTFLNADLQAERR